MGWVFIILAAVCIGLAICYNLMESCRFIVDSCSEAVARFFEFPADFFRQGNPIVLLVIVGTVLLAIACFMFTIDGTSEREGSGGSVPGREGSVTATIETEKDDLKDNHRTILQPEDDKQDEPITMIPLRLVDAISSEPVDRARIEVGQHIAYSNSSGTVEIPVDKMVSPGTVIKTTHPQYITKYLIKENVVEADTIHCRKKHNLIVVDWEYPKEIASEQLAESRLKSLRRRMEEQFAYCQEINLLAESLRDRIVEELYRIREDRAMYDPETITEVGDFLGATHGVFGEIRERKSGEIELKGYFVDLAKAKMLTSRSMLVPELDQLDGACTYLADLLISHFSEIRVLRPANGSQCARILSVDGYILFRPRHSHIWLSVLPEGQYLHYPQLPITIEKDGRWTASSVSIGDDHVKVPAVFHIKPILADPIAHRKIQEYLQRIREDRRSPGIDVTEWERERRCRIYEGIRVIRSQ